MYKPLRLKILMCLALGLLPSLTVASVEVNDIRLWRAPDHTRVVLDLSGATSHKVLELANPSRLVLDLNSTSMAGLLTDLPLEGTPISRVRSGIREGEHLRVVFDLSSEVEPKSFQLPPNERTGHRLVLDLFDANQQVQPIIAPPKKSVIKSDVRRPVVVAIDAGHGGEDPGALGPKSLREKNIVLQIANRLNAKFERSPMFRPVMIRTGDYYVTHKGRRDLARKNQADLFISVHADAFTHPSANGASVYALSTRGATSTTAQFLANKENAADLVGGVAVSDMDDVLAGVLTDLSMTGTLDSSLSVGSEVLGEMGKVAQRLHKTKVEQAAFLVLKSPDIPSILVETGFISNPKESSLLATPSYQDKMANAIFAGVQRWFKSNPPPGTLFARASSTAAPADAAPAERTVKVVQGDTLSAIAQRYAVSVQDLRVSNALSSNTIQVGQVLIIPESG
ncbi:MAG: N-acetylmuramoyl-L-alanine amidase AmiC [Halieaceae bacterium]|nr:MAG: N-acetylmuramoyl-L-alanine amidase AmiC [Halieaceae bacterium]